MAQMPRERYTDHEDHEDELSTSSSAHGQNNTEGRSISLGNGGAVDSVSMASSLSHDEEIE